MSKYPKTISAEHLAQIAEISDVIIGRDIHDTKREIEQHEHVLAGYDELAKWHWSDAEKKIARHKADAITSEIHRREEFVAYLERVQAARSAVAGVAS